MNISRIERLEALQRKLLAIAQAEGLCRREALNETQQMSEFLLQSRFDERVYLSPELARLMLASCDSKYESASQALAEADERINAHVLRQKLMGLASIREKSLVISSGNKIEAYHLFDRIALVFKKKAARAG